MKILIFVLCVLMSISRASASAPKECIGTEAEIHEALVALAISAKEFEAEIGELPNVWSKGVSEIIEKTPEIEKIGGNVNPGFDGNSFELVCSNFKDNSHTTFSINLTTYAINVNTIRKQR